MYSDNTLTPKEAVRMCALGTLAQKGAMQYSALAHAARHFMSRVTGPSLELMGTSLELLKYEGLVEAVDGSGMEDDAVLTLTEKGREELRTLLNARIRAGGSDLNKLVTTLKFRFMDLLPAEDQCQQLDAMVDSCEAEVARLADLRENHSDEPWLREWLDHDLDQLESRLAWLEDHRAQVYELAFPEEG